MLKFQNPAGYILILLFLAHCINDVFTTPILGNIPITPVQITIIGSIFYLLIRNRGLTSTVIQSLFVPAYLYYAFIFISTTILYIETGQVELYFLTLGFNLLLFRLLAPYLLEGFSAKDTRTFALSLCTILFFLCIMPALFEFITKSNVLPTQKGLSANVFYVRGFFTDKIELGTALGILIFLLILVLENFRDYFKRMFIFSIIVLGTLLIFFSFSTTALVGTLSGVIILLFSSIRNIVFKTLAFAFFVYFTYVMISGSSLFEEQVRSYQVKYTLNVERYGETNFRYLSFVKGLEKFLDKPLFGNGVSQSQVVIQEVLRFKKQVNPHNILVTELIDYGFTGTVFILLFLFRLYRLVPISKYNLSKYPHLNFLNRLTLALGIVILFRLILYYHRFDQLIYFFWASLVIMTYGMISKISFVEKRRIQI